MLFLQDNARFHTCEGLSEAVAGNNIKLEPRPPYSPDLNPIELDPIDLSMLKTARLQRNYSKLSKKQQRRLRARILKVGIAILTTCYMSPRTEGVVQQGSEGNIINALYNTS